MNFKTSCMATDPACRSQPFWSRARTKAQQILSDHHPTYLSADIEARIRGEFNILLES